MRRHREHKSRWGGALGLRKRRQVGTLSPGRKGRQSKMTRSVNDLLRSQECHPEGDLSKCAQEKVTWTCTQLLRRGDRRAGQEERDQEEMAAVLQADDAQGMQ